MDNEKIVGFHHLFSCSPFKTADYADLSDGKIAAMINFTGHKKPSDIQAIYDQMGIHHYSPEIKDPIASIDRLINFGMHYLRYDKNVLFYGNEQGLVSFTMVAIYLNLFYRMRVPQIRQWVMNMKPPKHMPIYNSIMNELRQMGIDGTVSTEMSNALLKFENQLKEQYTDKKADEEDRKQV